MSRYWIVALLCILAVAIAGYAIYGRHVPQSVAKSGPSPPAPFSAVSSERTPSTPTAKSPDMESGRKADAPGTVRNSFLSARRCYDASMELSLAKGVADCKYLEGKPKFAKQYAVCLNDWTEAHDRIVAAQSALARCDADPESIRKKYYAATKAAARAGDPDAEVCYLSSSFVDDKGVPHFTDEDVADYRADAPKFVEQALNRGDWRVVALFTVRNIDMQGGLRNYLEGIGKPETIYKMEKLLRLGASGDYAKQLDAALSVYTDPSSGMGLSKDQIAQADAWAKQMFAEHFAGEQGLTARPKVCEPEPLS